MSVILATHNRRDVVRRTLESLTQCGLDRHEFEIIVVDNASTDGTRETATELADILLPLSRNRGSCAKSLGAERASGRYLVFLDDDSYPRPGSLRRMIRHFEADPSLAAAGFTVHLPDGRLEGAALPGVFVGCGVGLRADAYRSVGGLDPTFFMQAEEYDLSFRLAGAGLRIAVFDDLHVEHLKTPRARRSGRTAYYDARNNLRVAARYLPDPYYDLYRADWIERYTWLARRDGHAGSHRRGVLAGRWRSALERRRYRDRRLSPGAFEFFFRWDEIRRCMSALAEAGVRSVVLADLGKNIYAFYQAARALRVDVAAIGDDRFATPGRSYRGVPILPLDEALAGRPDAVVVANTSAVHGTRTLQHVRAAWDGPVHFWFNAGADDDRGRSSSEQRQDATQGVACTTGA